MALDVELHVKEVAEDGYTIVENAIAPALLDELADALDRLERFFDVQPSPNSFEGHHTLRIYNLLAYDTVWQRVPMHEAVLAIVDQVLDPGCLISSLSSINIGPGEDAQPIHADDQLIPIPKPHPPTVCNSMWALTDFTAENGATRLIPGSHLRDHNPDYGAPYDSVAAEMPRGSVLIWHGSLWHGGGANDTADRRIGIAMNYCAGYIRQQENQQLGLPREKVATFEPRLQQLVGYGTYNMLIGHINKHAPIDLLVGDGTTNIVWDGIEVAETITIRDDARVRVITFNRPEALNAFNDEMYHAAGRALKEADARADIACVVLTGTGRAFSAGQDLAEMGQLSSEATPHDFGDEGPGFPHFLDTLAASRNR